ncbi:MAG: hypothetical protein LBJ47_08735, partial [Tannerella sp.]|nr:hypothetical protein [Tannerella sp.]
MIKFRSICGKKRKRMYLCKKKAQQNPKPETTIGTEKVRLREWVLQPGAKKVIGVTVRQDRLPSL